MSDFKPGSVVWLKSGDGPRMTIKSFPNSNEVTCNWFDGVKIKEFIFVSDQLTDENPAIPHNRFNYDLLTKEELKILSDLLDKATVKKDGK